MAVGRIYSRQPRIVEIAGRNPDVDAAVDIVDTDEDYTGFPASACEKLTLVSDSAQDDSSGSGCKSVRIVGLGKSWDIQTEDVALDGLTPVDTVKTWRRVFSITGLTGALNAGIITVTHKTTTTNIFAKIQAGYNTMQCCVYTVPRGCVGYLRNYHMQILDTGSNDADGALWVRPFGAAPYLILPFTVTKPDHYDHDLDDHSIVFPELTDIKLRVTRITTGNAKITGQMSIEVKAVD